MPEGSGKLRDWLKRAFAVDPPGPAQPTPEESAVIDKICAEIVRRRMVTPMLLGLEMSRPLNYVGAQTMHFFQPFVAALLPTGGYQRFAGFLERRGSIEYICRRIEALEAEGRDSTRGSPESEPSRAEDGSPTGAPIETDQNGEA